MGEPFGFLEAKQLVWSFSLKYALGRSALSPAASVSCWSKQCLTHKRQLKFKNFGPWWIILRIFSSRGLSIQQKHSLDVCLSARILRNEPLSKHVNFVLLLRAYKGGKVEKTHLNICACINLTLKLTTSTEIYIPWSVKTSI